MMLLNTTHKSFSLHALFQRIHCSTIRCPVLDDYEAAMHLSHWSSGFPNMAWPLKHGWILFVSNVKLNRASRLLIGGCCEVLRPCLPPARPIQLPVGFLHMSQEQSKKAQLPTWLLNVTVVSVVQFDSPLNLDTKSTDCKLILNTVIQNMSGASKLRDEWMMMVILIVAFTFLGSSLFCPDCRADVLDNTLHGSKQQSPARHKSLLCPWQPSTQWLRTSAMETCHPVPAIQRRHFYYIYSMYIWDSRVRRGVPKLFQARSVLYPAKSRKCRRKDC